MTTRLDDRRDLRLLDALLRTPARPRDLALGIGACGVVYLVGLGAIDLATTVSTSDGASGRGAASGFAMAVTGLVSFAFTLAAPAQVGTSLARDRASGAFDLAREAEASPGRRLAAYLVAPLGQAALATATAFAAAAPFVREPRTPLAAWAGFGAGVIALQALSCLVAGAWALMLPRTVTATTQGVGVLAPLALGLVAALAAVGVHGGAYLLALGVIVAATLSLWPVARALVERPERPRHAPAGALGAALSGLALGGLGWASSRQYEPSAAWFGAWAVATAVVTAAWTLPRAGRLALALREGSRRAGLTAVATAAGVSGLFALGAAVIPSRVAPTPAALAEGAALVTALAAVLTAGWVVVVAGPASRRGAYGGRAVLAGFAALFAEALLARSSAPWAARVDPFAGLWSRGAAEGAGLRVVMFAAATLAAAAVADRAWSRAERRVAAALDGAS